MISTDRLFITPLEDRHLEPLRKMRNDFATWHWLTSISPIFQQEQRDWWYALQRDKSKMYLAIEVLDTAKGVSMLSEYVFAGLLRSDEWDRTNRSVRIGVDIALGYRGKGYGTEAFLAFIDYLFKQQNMHRVWFLVSEGNKEARKLYEKVGFVEEGQQREALFRDGKYWNYIIMSMLEDEWTKRKK